MRQAGRGATLGTTSFLGSGGFVLRGGLGETGHQMSEAEMPSGQEEVGGWDGGGIGPVAGDRGGAAELISLSTRQAISRADTGCSEPPLGPHHSFCSLRKCNEVGGLF